jgi:hypothetical protein
VQADRPNVAARVIPGSTHESLLRDAVTAVAGEVRRFIDALR